MSVAACPWVHVSVCAEPLNSVCLDLYYRHARMYPLYDDVQSNICLWIQAIHSFVLLASCGCLRNICNFSIWYIVLVTSKEKVLVTSICYSSYSVWHWKEKIYITTSTSKFISDKQNTLYQLSDRSSIQVNVVWAMPTDYLTIYHFLCTEWQHICQSATTAMAHWHWLWCSQMLGTQ